MSTLHELRHGIANAWHAVEDGWRAITARAGTALTRFNPGEEPDGDDRQRIGWGLLAVDVEIRDTEVAIDLEVPGMDGDDFTVRLTDGALVVHGEKKIERERSEGNLHITERAYGAFERAIPLPVSVDESGGSASYDRGVLHIVLPRTEKPPARTIEVKTG
ncbi:MAG: Hsp20/alpha crystallin family protein [bacterium]|nr:Hsp20/alpha crystallin family protein [bacterium]